MAEAPMVTRMRRKLPARLVRASAWPAGGDSTIRGVMVNAARLRAVPAGVATVIRPAADGAAGTTAVILDAERTLNAAATPRNRTAVTLVQPDPVMVTFVPAAPWVGRKEWIPGVAEDDAVAGTATASPAKLATAAPASTARTANRMLTLIGHHIPSALGIWPREVTAR